MSRGKKKGAPRTLTEELSIFLEKRLLPDLKERAARPAVLAALQRRWEHEKSAARTAEKLDDWMDRTLEQVGAAWILSCVFLRTLEDRGLVANARIAGPNALDSEGQFYALAPHLSPREYLLMAFREVSRFPGAEELLGPRHNPAWRLSPSVEAAGALLELFRARNNDGELLLRFDGKDTRFLGDLYQDLSASVRARYALLQTPDFVERFILDLTLEPAIKEFGLDAVKLIDPTCGSGHFLLGAFDRLFEARVRREPAKDAKEHALAALAQVHGVDLNPYAVAIARFRLVLSFLGKTGIQRLSQAPRLHTNLVVADSLLHGARGSQDQLSAIAEDQREWGDELFTLEDAKAARLLLSQRYQAVVGNPPYITCKDAALRDTYRRLYPRSAAGKYALAAPFTERFFQLALDAQEGAGFVGLINSNSFMKREFGKKLIEGVLSRLDLARVLDTSGAYIPGHGTPTVLLFGRNRASSGAAVRAVLGKRGEPETPAHPSQGLVWSSVSAEHDHAGFENTFISVADMERAAFDHHPWSLGGGGAAELKELLEERADKTLGEVAEQIGIGSVTGEDDLYLQPLQALRRHRIETTRRLIIGEEIRDWGVASGEHIVFPYDEFFTLEPVDSTSNPGAFRWLWPHRSVLKQRRRFGTPMVERGLSWYELQELYLEKLRTPLSIVFAEMATHNHFVLDRGGNLFNRSAPVIKLPSGSTEDQHFSLMGYLNSSVTCFYLKQIAHKKTAASQKHNPDPARASYVFSSTAVGQLPLPAVHVIPAEPVRRLQKLAIQRATELSFESFSFKAASFRNSSDVHAALAAMQEAADSARDEAIYLQEELDWFVYGLWGLCSPEQADARFTSGAKASLGSRAFEFATGYDDGVTARVRTSVSTQEAQQICPEHWKGRRSLLMNADIALIESSVFKRQWRDSELNMDQADFRRSVGIAFAREFVMKTLEESVSKLASITSVRDILRSMPLATVSTLGALSEFLCEDLGRLAIELARSESIPYQGGSRLTDSGVLKRAKWEATWELQRREDRGEHAGEIELPPRYESDDYRDPVYWRMRGKLDVPKERFISYPGCEKDNDPSPLLGWAGWDHLQRASALAALYDERKNRDGWTREKLSPILAGLHELIPWLLQWHNDPSPAFDGARPGEQYAAFLDTEARALGLTQDDLRNWTPPKKSKGKKTKAPAPERPEGEQS